MKFRYFLIVALAFFGAGAYIFHGTTAFGQNSTVNVLNPFKVVAGYILPRDVANGLQINSLASCDTIDTDANGKFVCGTDLSGGSGTLAGGVTSALTYWTGTTTVSATTSPTVGYITATTTTASRFPFASSTAISATTFFGALSGNALTATALGANGANCAAGQSPLGVDASGAVESCFDVWTESENTSAGYTTLAAANSYIHSSTTIPKTYTANTFTGLQTIGNASTTHLSVSGSSYLGTVRSGTWNGTAIGDTYLTKSGDWTGTIDGNNFAGGAIGAGELIYGGSAGSFSELTLGASSTILTNNGTSPTWIAGSSLCVAITGSADLCDGSDASGTGGTGLATSTAIADTYVIYGTSAGTVGAEAAFNYDDATNNLTVGYLSASYVRAIDGAIDTPSIYFSSDSDTGLYLNGANGLGLTAGAAGVTWNGSAFYPNTDSARNLGISATNKWNNLYVNYASTTALSATTLYGALTGNASTATALAANGSNCAAGQSPLGVDASGAVESCFDVWTEAENTSAAYLNTTGVNNYIHSSTTIPKTYTANTFTALQTIGNASTTHLSVSGSSYLGTVRSGTWNGTSLADAYVDDNITASNYLSLAAWFGTTSAPHLTTLAGVTSIGTDAATTTAQGNWAADAFGIAGKWFADATRFIVQVAAQFTAGLTVLDFLDIPSSTNPTVDAEGEIAINTTAASSSLRYFDGTAERVLSPIVERSFSFASTTLDYMGDFGAAGTTTILLMNSDRPITLTDIYCKTNTGTTSIQFSDGTNKTDELRCGPNGTEDDGTLANSTWTRREDFKIEVGSSVGTPGNITVTAGIRTDAD